MPLGSVPNERLRYMRIGYRQVSSTVSTDNAHLALVVADREIA